MFIPLAKRGSGAFTSTDLVIALAVVFVLGALALAQFKYKRRAQALTVCAKNNKQLGVATLMFSGDSYEGTPWSYPDSRGSRAFTNSGMVLPHFLAISNEIGNTKILTCPADNRRATTNWVTLNDGNISYFINFDAKITQPNRMLYGDRRFTSSLAPNALNMLVLNTNSTYGWEMNIHGEHGVLSYGDGSVRQSPLSSLNAEFQNITNLGSRIQLPR